MSGDLTLALAISSCNAARLRANTVRKRGFSAAWVALARTHLSQPSSRATYSVRVVAVIIGLRNQGLGFLPDGDLYHLRYPSGYMVSNVGAQQPSRAAEQSNPMTAGGARPVCCRGGPQG